MDAKRLLVIFNCFFARTRKNSYLSNERSMFLQTNRPRENDYLRDK